MTKGKNEKPYIYGKEDKELSYNNYIERFYYTITATKQGTIASVVPKYHGESC